MNRGKLKKNEKSIKLKLEVELGSRESGSFGVFVDLGLLETGGGAEAALAAGGLVEAVDDAHGNGLAAEGHGLEVPLALLDGEVGRF